MSFHSMRGATDGRLPSYNQDFLHAYILDQQNNRIFSQERPGGFRDYRNLSLYDPRLQSPSYEDLIITTARAHHHASPLLGNPFMGAPPVFGAHDENALQEEPWLADFLKKSHFKPEEPVGDEALMGTGTIFGEFTQPERTVNPIELMVSSEPVADLVDMHLDYDESVADLVDMDLVYDEPAADRVYMDLDYDEPLEDHARFGEDMTIKDDITTGDDSSFRDDTPFTYDTPFGDPTSVRDPAPVAPPAPQPNFPQPPQRPGEIEMATINQPGDSMSPIKIPLEDGTVIYRCPIPSCGKDYQTHSGYSKHKMRELKRTVPCYHFGCDYFSYRAGQTRTHFLSDHPGFSLPPHLEVGVRGETVRYQD